MYHRIKLKYFILKKFPDNSYVVMKIPIIYFFNIWFFLRSDKNSLKWVIFSLMYYTYSREIIMHLMLCISKHPLKSA